MRLFKQLFSGWFMGILLVFFAFVIGYATFIENDYGANGAKLLVYNTAWFEFLLFLMIVNFSGMVFTKQLYHRGKINILIIHLALIIIILGAGATRYFGNEGQMHIREGQTTDQYVSSEKYVQIQFEKDGEVFKVKEKVLLSSARPELFSKSYQWKGEKIEIRLGDFIKSASQEFVRAEGGSPYVSIVVGDSDGRHEFYIKEGETKFVHNFGIAFGDTTNKKVVTIIRESESLFIRLPESFKAKGLETEEGGGEIGGFTPLGKMTLHNFGSISLVVKEYIPSAKLEYVKNEDNARGIPLVTAWVNNQELLLPNGKEQVTMIDDIQVSVKVGAIPLELPFKIKLVDFQLERYPGSSSPSSYASQVILVDDVNNVEFPYKIYMNHILNYQGYRFFQSSYDTDEKGTILSVNFDYWGTSITYFGYFVLFASLIASFFIGKSRFKRISNQITEVHDKRKKMVKAATIMVFGVFFSTFAMAQNDVASKEHAEIFGTVLIQNIEGRIEPINTMATKILVKLSKKNTYKGYTADQVFLGIMTNQVAWQEEALIKVGDKAIQDLIGVNGKNASFADFIDDSGQYKIKTEVETAHAKKPSIRSTFDKEIINVDERVNIFYMVLNGSVLRIFPLENDANNKWVIPQEFHTLKGHGVENADLFEDYILGLKKAIESNQYQEVNSQIELIKSYQKEISKDIIPSSTEVKVELLYNKYAIFKSLFPFYLIIGLVLIGVFFFQTFNPKFEFKILTNILFWTLVLAFALQTLALAARWYITGHAPWSNGYESMIYISWATVLAGFVLKKKSSITLGVTAVVAGITLLTAHFSWLNPELTNLVPVLKSYWLTIHVATITASYGFLALGCMIGFLNLCIMIFRNENNYERIKLTLKELSLVTEMALSIGLILLIIGNFLGGIWANESWGRYWGWDPKETWTLVTIVVYSFTLHLTLIPAIRNSFSFNFFATISFAAVIMTYFGVNYYLSGLHSYAAGDAVPIPSSVYYTLAVLGIVSVLAAYNEFTFVKKRNE